MLPGRFCSGSLLEGTFLDGTFLEGTFPLALGLVRCFGWTLLDGLFMPTYLGKESGWSF